MTNNSEIKNVINVFTDGIKYYIKHFTSLFKYMSFPVFGQILGIIIVFTFTFIYMLMLPALSAKYLFFQNILNSLAVCLLIILPGLIIMLKAFWEYLIAYGAINSITANMVKSGNIYDISAHKKLITNNTPQFILLWLIISILIVLAIIPIFWIPALVLFVYFSFVFQVFTFDEKPNAINAFKTSFNMIKGHFAATFVLILLTALVSYTIIPKLFCILISLAGLDKFFLGALKLSESTILIPSAKLTALEMYKLIESSVVSSVITMLLLPMRSITWTLWYKKLITGYKHEQRKITKSGTKQLDPQILDRAMEDYE